MHETRKMDSTSPLLLFLILVINLIEALGYELEITSSLPNSTCQLNVSFNSSEEPLTLSADPYKSCDLKIQSTKTSRFLISISTGNITATGYMYEYFYIERLESENQCYHRYVAFRHPLQTCDVHFRQQNTMHLHFLGNFSISIDEDKTLETNSSDRCLEDINQEDTPGQESGCKMKGYESIIQCVEIQEYGLVKVRCNVQCPDNCSCILGDKEVEYSCPKTNYQHQIKNTFLLFPTDILTFNIGPRDSKIDFDFSRNGLTALMADSFTSIRKHILELDISDNKLVSLPPGSFNGLHELDELNLSTNHLKSLPPQLFNGLHELSKLWLGRNRLEALPQQLFSGLHKLYLLFLDHNYLVSLPSDLFNRLYDLRFLYLNNNYLESLPADLFKGLYKSKIIGLRDNRLVSLLPDLFNDLHGLEVLYLNFNYLESLPADLFKGLHKLKSIWLGNNTLVSLPPNLFDGLHELYTLYLDNNYLESLPVDLFKGLHKVILIGLENNRLVSLSPDLFNGLQELYELWLHHNYLESLPADLFTGLHKLQSIWLGNNRLVSLPPDLFKGLHELDTLWLDHNNLDLLPAVLFNDLNSLVNLRLENNFLVSLPTELFETNGLLEYLYLMYNQLQYLSFHFFDNLVKLVLLDLSNNRLTHIPRLGQMNQLRTLKLIGNPLTGITHEHFNGIQETVTTVVDQSVVCVCYMNVSDTCFNTKERSPYLTCSSLLSLTVLSVFTWILGICATIGNGFVLLWKQSKYSGQENKVQSLILSNLAASDLLMGIYMIIIASADAYYRENFPMNAEEWRSGLTCKIAGTLAFTSSEASVFFVTLISIDRFINIKFPYTIRKLRIKSTRWSSFIVWAISLSLGLSASIFAGRDLEFYDNSHVCIGLPLAQLVRFDTKTTSVNTGIQWVNGIGYTRDEIVNVVTNQYRSPGLYFSVAVFIGLNMLCFLLILSCYIIIIKTVFQTSKAASRQREMAEEIRMTVKVSAIVLTDFFCWFPICLIGALVQAGVVTIPADTFAWIVTFVLPVNSAINPFMYTIGSLIGGKCERKSPPSNQVKMQPVSPSLHTTADNKT